ncbi:MAG: TonB-dependent receptor [Pedobacter sp.]|nr:TonB-dependent receptor [Pedobacter sp.]
MTINKTAFWRFHPVTYYSAILLVVFCYAPFDVNAQIDSLALDEVKIQSISRRQTSSTPLQLLSGEELKNLNSLSVADAIRFFSGVQIKDYGGIGGLKTINVRSMGSNYTGVFYEGVQLSNAQNGQVDLGKFSLDNISEIEIYSGQKSAIFQAAKGFSVGSSLYLKTMNPQFKYNERYHVNATIKTGSFGLFNPSVSIQNKLSNEFSGSANAEYTKATGKYKFRYTNGVFDTIAVRNNSDVERMRFEYALHGLLRDSSIFNTRVYLYNDQMGLPGAIVSNKFDYLQRTWNKNAFLQTSFQKAFGEKYTLLAAGKYGYDYNRYLDPENVSLNGLLDRKFKLQEVYLSLANQYRFNKIWELVLSTDYQFNTLDANIYRFSYPSRNTFLTALAIHANFNKVDIQANVLGTYLNDRVEDGTPAGDKQKLTPTLMLSWQPFTGKEFRLRSFYKSIYRMPTFNDLYYTDFGRTYLKPEYAKQYDLGLTYVKRFKNVKFQQLSVQADGYYNQVKDKIVALPGNNAQRWSIENIGYVNIKGFDLNLQSFLRLNELALNVGLTYTYQDAIDVTPISQGQVSYKRQLPYTPTHSGSFLGGAAYRTLSMNYSFIYTGERYNQKANIPVNYVEPWYTHDLALHYLLKLGSNELRLSLEINNLLNQYYDVVANFPMPGRSYRFTLNYKI